MLGKDFTYFKFACELIDAGIWAKLSPGARTLYPVLLRFTDRNFSPVYPGTKKLLELTGFKQKSSLRKARKELVDFGLISITTGTGRKNTVYHFRFDWISPRSTLKTTPEEQKHTPQNGIDSPPNTTASLPPQAPIWQPPYNQIQISINNNQSTDGTRNFTNTSEKKSQENLDEFYELRKQFGSQNVDLAISEAKLADLPITYATIEKILKANHWNFMRFETLLEILKQKVSESTFKIIKNSFLREENGFLIFTDSLPMYLKNILYKLCENILFEPVNPSTNFATRMEWR
ncbi:MAG: helix-turn-helix domain-containing protein [Leptonema sp. (in: bacteria)]